MPEQSDAINANSSLNENVKYAATNAITVYGIDFTSRPSSRKPAHLS